MRPLRLELEGFTSFRQRTCLDLTDLDLFAVTGPTGAGKSSLIDAISYALFGRVPRVANEVVACISQGLDRMTVTLEFATGEQRYRIFRETRRKGTPNVRLEHLWTPEEWSPVAQGAAEVNRRVTDIIGLDYDAFTRSVLLPQGQFQEFLAGAARERREVLARLLGIGVYEEMQRRANQRARDLQRDIEASERRLREELADATPENLERIEADLAARRGEAARLEALGAALEQGLALAQAWKSAARQAAAARASAVAAQTELEATASLVREGGDALAELTRELQDLQQRLAVNTFDAQRLADLTLARERLQSLDNARSDAARLQTGARQASSAATAAQKAAAQAAQRHDKAEADLRRSEAAYQEAQRHDLAASLQAGLKPGDACPVCGGVVGELTPLTPGALAAAQSRLQEARKAEADLRRVRQKAETDSGVAQSRASQAEARLQEASTRLDAARAALLQVLPDQGEHNASAIAAALQSQIAARKERDDLQSLLAGSQAQVEGSRATLDAARGRLESLQRQADEARGALESSERAASDARSTLDKQAETAGWQDLLAAATEPEALETALRGARDRAQQGQHAALQAIGGLEARIDRLRSDIETAERLRRELRGTQTEHHVAADLSQMLQANRFQSWVQQEALVSLAAEGSRRLQELSLGRYRLEVDERGQDFAVIDRWNNDEARPVKTLSGGETFLASLSLALALAESLPSLAAGGRVVLDSIFLDEGFGSLDAEALDRAADALDALRSQNRMVCVVTHLPELAQRLPARVVVSKSQTGSSVSIE